MLSLCPTCTGRGFLKKDVGRSLCSCSLSRLLLPFHFSTREGRGQRQRQINSSGVGRDAASRSRTLLQDECLLTWALDLYSKT